jgi:hypothetical protein
MNLVGTILVYAALLALLAGLASVVRPLTFIGISSRSTAVLVLLSGGLVILIAAILPAVEEKIDVHGTLLDDFVPAYQFGEFHSIRIKAPRDRVYAAIREVTPNEISLFATLTWIRRFGRPVKEGVLSPPPNEPILALSLRTNFMKLAEDPYKEIVLGTLVVAPKEAWPKKDATPDDFKALHTPGYALAAMNFRLSDTGHSETLLTTETRVYATDASTRRKFAAYWRVIYPGSSLIRVMWLRAIRRRAERMPR